MRRNAVNTLVATHNIYRKLNL